MSLVEYVKVIESDPEQSPACSHGPALLFDRVGKRFFACSACRDRKLCPLYVDVGVKRSFKTWRQIRDRHVPQKAHEEPPQMKDESLFCAQCCCIYTNAQNVCVHGGLRNVNSSEAKHPSRFLAQLSTNKGHAQYHFEAETLEFIVRLAARFDKVLCLGTPSIFEQLRCLGVACHLADIDRRLEAFYAPTEFTWFNMLNGLAFRDGHESALWRFVGRTPEDRVSLSSPDNKCQNEATVRQGDSCTSRRSMEAAPAIEEFGECSARQTQKLKRRFPSELDRKKQRKRIMEIFNPGSPENETPSQVAEESDLRLGPALIVVDPPFGGLLGPLAKTLNDLTKCGTWSRVLVFPYFNEAQVNLHFPSLKMCDLAIRYRNQRKMKDDSSPVRIFTDIPLNRITLPEPVYKYCAQCDRWVHSVNTHCEECGVCPSKNHAATQHCGLCQRCVKRTWHHCTKCERCHLADVCDAHRGGERTTVQKAKPFRHKGKTPVHHRKKMK